MRVRDFIQLEEAYKDTVRGIDPDDIEKRNVLLVKYASSVIVEGVWFELKNLEKWAKENLHETLVDQVWYGKTGYDFGFVEYFFNDQVNAEKFAAVISKIYTTYPNSYPPGEICRSEGYDKHILYDPADLTAIVY